MNDLDFWLDGITSEYIINQLRNDTYEEYERKLASDLFDSTDHVAELGGAIGYVAHKLAPHVKSWTTVEANPYVYQKLVRNCLIGPNKGMGITPLFGAVSTQTLGMAHLNIRDEYWTSSLSNYKNQYSHVIDVVKVPALAFNMITADKTAIMCDIEGAELHFARVNLAIPDSVKKIVIELHPAVYEAAGTKQVNTWILGNGFHAIDQLFDVVSYSR